jgi:hypothetical protein
MLWRSMPDRAMLWLLKPFIASQEIVSLANCRASRQARKRCYNLGHSYLFCHY